ncbi:hypothetical protein FQN60_002478, partial [Etheostoma spectabile]
MEGPGYESDHVEGPGSDHDPVLERPAGLDGLRLLAGAVLPRHAFLDHHSGFWELVFIVEEDVTRLQVTQVTQDVGRLSELLDQKVSRSFGDLQDLKDLWIYKVPEVPSLDLGTYEAPEIPSVDLWIYEAPEIPSLDLRIYEATEIPSEDLWIYGAPEIPCVDLWIYEAPEIPAVDYEVPEIPSIDYEDINVQRKPDKDLTVSPDTDAVGIAIGTQRPIKHHSVHGNHGTRLLGLTVQETALVLVQLGPAAAGPVVPVEGCLHPRRHDAAQRHVVLTVVSLAVMLHPQPGRQTERQTERRTERERDGQAETDRDRQADRERQTSRQIGRDRQTGRQADRQTEYLSPCLTRVLSHEPLRRPRKTRPQRRGRSSDAGDTFLSLERTLPRERQVQVRGQGSGVRGQGYMLDHTRCTCQHTGVVASEMLDGSIVSSTLHAGGAELLPGQVDGVVVLVSLLQTPLASSRMATQAPLEPGFSPIFSSDLVNALLVLMVSLHAVGVPAHVHGHPPCCLGGVESDYQDGQDGCFRAGGPCPEVAPCWSCGDGLRAVMDQHCLEERRVCRAPAGPPGGAASCGCARLRRARPPAERPAMRPSAPRRRRAGLDLDLETFWVKFRDPSRGPGDTKKTNFTVQRPYQRTWKPSGSGSE